MCDCYKIGGPFVTYDPDCPAHGIEAQQTQKQREADDAARDAEIARLNLRVARLTSGSEAANLAGRVVEQDREIARLYRALAAGPAALRAHGRSEGHLRVASMDGCADLVEAAQAAAMKEGK